MIFNRIRSSIGKIYSRGRHTVGKVYSGTKQTVGKLNNLFHDLGDFIQESKKFIPIVKEVVDIASDFVPGGGLAKTALKVGLRGLDAFENFNKSVSRKGLQAETLLNKPSVKHFRDLVT